MAIDDRGGTTLICSQCDSQWEVKPAGQWTWWVGTALVAAPYPVCVKCGADLSVAAKAGTFEGPVFDFLRGLMI